TVALGTGLARERRLLITGEPPKRAEDRERPNPNACTGLAEHLLPRRHELIQSFLSTEQGDPLAAGDLIQVVRGDRLISELVFHFKDGSVDDEVTVFSQKGNFRLLSDHHVQKGPAFPHPMDVSINASTGEVQVRSTENGK